MKDPKKKNKPLISVVMPAYNAQKYIKSAIESILNQTLEKFELIIINDCSTDRTLDIIKLLSKRDPRIKIVNNDRKLDIAGALNKGISMASSNIIARMDADDISLADRLELQYKLLNSFKKLAVVGSDVIIIDARGRKIGERGYPDTSSKLKACLFKYSPFAHPVAMFKKNMFDEVGGYDPKYSPTEDLDLWFRLGRKHTFGSVGKPLLKYRVYEKSSSHSVLRNLELLVFKIRLKAITKYGYKPNPHDIIYNLLQFATLWFTPARYRIRLYNLLRNKNLI